MHNNEAYYQTCSEIQRLVELAIRFNSYSDAQRPPSCDYMIVKGRYYIPNFVKGNVAFQSPAYEFATYDICVSLFNSLPASGDFCRLLIIFANSFDPDQDRQDVYRHLVLLRAKVCRHLVLLRAKVCRYLVHLRAKVCICLVLLRAKVYRCLFLLRAKVSRCLVNYRAKVCRRLVLLRVKVCRLLVY